jgi:hypothetical protein
MATTDAKSGFRLPWSADRNDSDGGAEPSVDQPAGASETTGSETDTMNHAQEGPAPSATADAADGSAPDPATPVRKPNKFMADLTRAMQAAAEAARADTLERFGAEAKSHIESIHTSTGDEATKLRKRADEDVAAIRDWSKTEIARIRDEADEQIAHRKDKLEREIEAHAAEIERRIDGVQRRVDRFEQQMAEFFERLLAEEDPTRFAAMAESLPEPPPFDDDSDWSSASEAVIEPAVVPAAPAEVEPAPAEIAPPSAEVEPVSAEAETVTSETDTPARESTGWEPATLPQLAVDGPSAGASLEPVSGWPASDTAATPDRHEAPMDEPSSDGRDLFGDVPDVDAGGDAQAETESAIDGDPRLAALGFDPDLAAAEAEAGAFPVATEASDEPIPVIADDALAARLAGLVHEEPSSSETTTTRVIVTGLVSVASIAGFKRNLARVPGVQSVGVSSGPDGEFVFAVSHDAGLSLSEAIATLPGFGTRVTAESPGQLTVAARDPEAEG